MGDEDRSNSISNGEFVRWMKSSAAGTFRAALESSVLSHKHFVQAAFRIWDANGDGTISKEELVSALKQVNPSADQEMIDSLFRHMDADNSDHVDYNEFVNFLWGSA